MGEMFLRRQAHGFQVLRCRQYVEQEKPLLLDRLGSDDFRTTFRFQLVRVGVVVLGARAHAALQPDGVIALVVEAQVVGHAVGDGVVELTSALQPPAYGFLRMRIEEVEGLLCQAVIAEEDES